MAADNPWYVAVALWFWGAPGAMMGVGIAVIVAGTVILGMGIYRYNNPFTAPDKPSGANAQEPAATKNSPSINAGRDVNIGHIGDIIVQAKPPTVSIIESHPPKKNDDGTVLLEFALKIVSQSPPNNLVVAVAKADVAESKDFRFRDVFGLGPKGGGIVMETGGDNGEYYFKKIQAPTAGEYILYIKVPGPETKPRIQVGLD